MKVCVREICQLARFCHLVDMDENELLDNIFLFLLVLSNQLDLELVYSRQVGLCEPEEIILKYRFFL